MIILDMTTVISPTILAIQVIEMDERLRTFDRLWYTEDFEIKSVNNPALDYRTLFLRGSERHYDNYVSVRERDIIYSNYAVVANKLQRALRSFTNSDKLKSLINYSNVIKKVSFKYRTHKQVDESKKIIIKYSEDTFDPTESSDIISTILRRNPNGLIDAMCTRHRIYTEEASC
jgi:hypothetical protein